MTTNAIHHKDGNPFNNSPENLLAVPLAQRITQGPIIAWPSDPCFLYVLNANGYNRITVTIGHGLTDDDKSTPREERHATAELITEALTVASETGRTPRQLAVERAELIAALEAITERAEAVASDIPVKNRHEGVSQATHVAHMASHLEQHAKIARSVLNRLTP